MGDTSSSVLKAPSFTVLIARLGRLLTRTVAAGLSLQHQFTSILAKRPVLGRRHVTGRGVVTQVARRPARCNGGVMD